MQQWYVKFPREEIGPIADNQLIAYRDIGHVTRETLLHNRDGNWKKATRTLATVVWVVAIIVISILTLITLFGAILQRESGLTAVLTLGSAFIGLMLIRIATKQRWMASFMPEP